MTCRKTTNSGQETVNNTNNATIVSNATNNIDIAKITDIPHDPFMIYLSKFGPTINFNTSENVVRQRISYKNFDEKEIDFGDAESGTFLYIVYLFSGNIFNGVEHVQVYNDGLSYRQKEIDIHRNKDGLVERIDRYSVGESRLILQHTYKYTGNIIVTNDGPMAVTGVIIAEDSKFTYYRNYQYYIDAPDEPEVIIEFINDDVIIDLYYSSPWQHGSRSCFSNGILMKTEYFSNQPRTETYTVSSGTGEIIVTGADGTETERRFLERKVNDAGYLEYEAVRFPTGRGYEYFITKDTFK
jgi:hypothetical protein